MTNEIYDKLVDDYLSGKLTKYEYYDICIKCNINQNLSALLETIQGKK